MFDQDLFSVQIGEQFADLLDNPRLVINHFNHEVDLARGSSGNAWNVSDLLVLIKGKINNFHKPTESPLSLSSTCVFLVFVDNANAAHDLGVILCGIFYLSQTLS